MAEWWEKLRLPVAVLVIVGLGMAAAALLQGNQSQPGSAPVAATASPAPVRPVKVHVTGGVRSPAVYALTTDHRIEDAIRAAGGPTDDADIQRLNLAAHLADGEQIVVPRRLDPAQQPAAASGPDPRSATGNSPSAPVTNSDPAAVIDINRADRAALESLPGIGPVTAEKIIAHRQANGPFTRIEELRETKLVGQATFEKIRDLIVVR